MMLITCTFQRQINGSVIKGGGIDGDLEARFKLGSSMPGIIQMQPLS